MTITSGVCHVESFVTAEVCLNCTDLPSQTFSVCVCVSVYPHLSDPMTVRSHSSSSAWSSTRAQAASHVTQSQCIDPFLWLIGSTAALRSFKSLKWNARLRDCFPALGGKFTLCGAFSKLNRQELMSFCFWMEGKCWLATAFFVDVSHLSAEAKSAMLKSIAIS